jgi:hypothetical protein
VATLHTTPLSETSSSLVCEKFVSVPFGSKKWPVTANLAMPVYEPGTVVVPVTLDPAPGCG